jgi:hypothetical protein
MPRKVKMDILAFPAIAGVVSVTLYTVSNAPMVAKAWVTKNLSSYSFWNIILCNVANLFHWFYITSLPVGPIWVLHLFCTCSYSIMLMLFCLTEKTLDANINQSCIYQQGR